MLGRNFVHESPNWAKDKVRLHFRGGFGGYVKTDNAVYPAFSSWGVAISNLFKQSYISSCLNNIDYVHNKGFNSTSNDVKSAGGVKNDPLKT